MSKNFNKIVASSAVACLVVTSSAVPAFAATGKYAGNNRIDTAIKIAQTSWENTWKGQTIAVLASSNNANLVDALAVAPLAYAKKAPILLTENGDKVSEDVLAELKARKVKTVYLAAGTGVLTDAMKAQLEKEGMTVERLGGANRYETAKNIASKLEKSTKVAVVNGEVGMADALSIASYAAANNVAIAFTPSKDKAPEMDMTGKTVYAIGGEGVLSNEVVNSMKATRFGGNGRLETNAEVIKGLAKEYKFETTYVADGDTLVDALTGSVLAGQTNSTIVLARNNELADAQKEVLKANLTKTSKVEAFGGAVETAKAAVENIANPTAPTGDVKIEKAPEVKAIGANKVEVKYAAETTGAGNSAAYKVVEKGTTTEIAVKSVAVDGKYAVLEMDKELASGKAYTLTVDGKTANFSGVSKVTSAPEIKSAECKDTNRVRVTFNKILDEATAETVANYTLNNGATVKEVKLSSDRKFVTLTTEGVANNKQYTVTVENVKNVDGYAMKKVPKQFTGRTDTATPTIKSIRTMTNNRVEVIFSDVHGIDKTTAGDVANYSIKEGSNDLKVQSVKVDKTNPNAAIYDRIEIVTDAQTSGKKYTVTINNLKDASVAANTITKALTKDFYGRAIDKIAPSATSKVKVKSPTLVEVSFSDESALDVASATNPDNYKFSGDIKVEKAEIKDTDVLYKEDGRTVVLTTSTLENKSYNIDVKDVQDEFGNAMKSKKLYFSVSSSQLSTAAPHIVGLKSLSETKLQVTFDKYLDKATAQDPTNYSFNKDLGCALSAELQDDEMTVEIVTNSQTANEEYELTVNNVKGLVDNPTSNVKQKFIATRTTIDNSAPEIEWVETINENEIRVHFNEAVKVKDKATVIYGKINGSAPLKDVETKTADILIENDETLVVRVGKLFPNVSYAIQSITGLTDTSNNEYVAEKDVDKMSKFDGTDTKNEAPTFESCDQVALNKVRVRFSENVVVDSNSKMTSIFEQTIDKFEIDSDDHNVLIITSKKAFKAKDTKYTIDFRPFIKDLTGADVSNKAEISIELKDEDKPTFEYAEAVHKNKIVLTYSEDIESQGSYKVTYKDDKDKEQTVRLTGTKVASGKVELSTDSDLKQDRTYTVEVLSGARDLAGNLEEKGTKRDCSGSNVIPNEVKVNGVKVINASTVQIVLPKAPNADNKQEYPLTVKNVTDDVTTTTTITFAKGERESDEVELKNFMLIEGKSYEFNFSTYNVDLDKGIAADLNVAINNKSEATTTTSAISFSGVDNDKKIEIYEIKDGVVNTGKGIANTAYKYADGVLKAEFKNDNTIGWFAGKVFVVISNKDKVIYTGVVEVK